MRKLNIFILMLFLISTPLTIKTNAFIGEWHAGNKITPLWDPIDGSKFRRSLVDSATHHIHMIAYVIHPDEVGLAMVKALRNAANRGVKVRIIIPTAVMITEDPDNIVMDGLKDPRLKNIIEIITAPKLSIFDNGSPFGLNTFHEKILLIDGKQAVIGGRHPSKMALDERDFDFLVEGPVVKDVARAFKNSWELATELMPGEWSDLEEKAITNDEIISPIISETSGYFPFLTRFTDGVNARAIQHEAIKQIKIENKSFGYKNQNEIEDVILDEIKKRLFRKETKEVNFYSIFPIMRNNFRNALIKAAKNGVKVNIICNSRASAEALEVFKFPLLKRLNALPYISTIDDQILMLENGINIYQWQSSEALVYLHAKVMTIDDVVFFGSHNFNLPSSLSNNEIVIETTNNDLADKLKNIFYDDIKNNTKPATIKMLTKEKKHLGSKSIDFSKFFFELY